MTNTLKACNEHTWSTFVRPSVKLKSFPDTRKTIVSIMPYFPRSCKIIAGWLDEADQFWKVNYHWEYLLSMLDKALSLGLAPALQATLKGLREEMMQNPPNPKTGYKASPTVGQPVDHSTHDVITQRWQTMKSVKQRFGQIVDQTGLITKSPPAAPWQLSVAPVARPGSSKHGAGYALDIEGHGQNHTIKQIVTQLGATLAFDEKSHVHVEFKNGVKLPPTQPAAPFSRSA
jgi:hypothetical protein